MTEYEYVSPQKIMDMSYELGEKIKKSEFEPEILLGISRGGLCIVRFLSDLFNISEIYIIRVVHYKDIEKRKSEPKLLQDVDESLLRDKRVLIVDDISDTGKSLKYVTELIKKKRVKEFKTATLHYKPWSEYKPDYFIEEINKWVIYPWEVGETIRSIMRKDVSKEEKAKELERTGIPESKIDQYLKVMG